MNTKSFLALSLATAAVIGFSGCTASTDSGTADMGTKGIPVLKTYADIAHDNYADALSDAKALLIVIERFVAYPTAANLEQAKKAWLASRESYGQTEIFRLSNGPIDAEEGWVADAYGALEGQINAWPLDENMIDYTIDADGKRTSGNIIDTKGSFTPGGEEPKAVDVTQISTEAIAELNENGGEANVATGYHAIEFLLWGQDQDYSNFMADNISKGALVAGERPLSDFTTDANANRRLAYLKAATDKLVHDLEIVSAAWSKNVSGDCSQDSTGCYRGALLGQLKGADASKNIPAQEGLKQIMAGMGVFIKSELANERIAVAVLTPSEEDEHSCFSDNTHRDIATNYGGFKNALMGVYNGRKYGPAFYDTVNGKTRIKMDQLISEIDASVNMIDDTAVSTMHFDYQILPDNHANEIRSAKNKMRKLGDMMVDVASAQGISLTQDDVTDPEETKL